MPPYRVQARFGRESKGRDRSTRIGVIAGWRVPIGGSAPRISVSGYHGDAGRAVVSATWPRIAPSASGTGAGGWGKLPIYSLRKSNVHAGSLIGQGFNGAGLTQHDAGTRPRTQE